MQSNLKWSQQIESLEDKLKTRLTGLEKLKYVMNRFTKKNIVQGVFTSVLCYCLPLFGGCNVSEIKIFQVQQNRAARCVLNLPPRTSRDSMYDKLGWLTVQQLTIPVLQSIGSGRTRNQNTCQASSPETTCMATLLSRTVAWDCIGRVLCSVGQHFGTSCQRV